MASLTLLELANGNEPVEDIRSDNGNMEPITPGLVEISFHAILGKSSGSMMKLQGLWEDAWFWFWLIVDQYTTLPEKIVEETQLPV